LCGQLPFASERLRSASAAEIERILQDETPPAPSSRLTRSTSVHASADTSHPGRTARALRGDLDWIALKALEKERHRRYGSALALAEDIERHLGHRPVLAGPPTISYRFKKLVRRHRVEVGAACLVAVAVAVSLLLGLVHAGRTAAALAETREFFELGRRAVDGLLARARDPRLEEVPRAEAVRQAMLGDALEYYSILRSRRPTDPRLQQSVAYAEASAAALLQLMGRSEDAIDSAQRAVAIAEGIVREAPDDAGGKRLLAEARFHRALALAGRGVATEVRDDLKDLIGLYQSIPAAERIPDDDEMTGNVWFHIGRFCTDSPADALRAFDEALADFDSIAEPDIGLRLRAAESRSHRGRALAELGRLGDAEADTRQALVLLEEFRDVPLGARAIGLAYGQLWRTLIKQQRLP
jgi:tetratricopeptide (TPR) repeat protein